MPLAYLLYSSGWLAARSSRPRGFRLARLLPLRQSLVHLQESVELSGMACGGLPAVLGAAAVELALWLGFMALAGWV